MVFQGADVLHYAAIEHPASADESQPYGNVEALRPSANAATDYTEVKRPSQVGNKAAASLSLGETCKRCLFHIFFPFYPRIWMRIRTPLTPRCTNPSRRSSSTPTCFQPGRVQRSEGSGPSTATLHGTLGTGRAWGHRDGC